MSVLNNPATSGFPTVHFGLANRAHVQIKIYDVAGRIMISLADRTYDAGEHEIVWDRRTQAGGEVPRGIYFIRMRFPDSGLSSDAKLVIVN